MERPKLLFVVGFKYVYFCCEVCATVTLTKQSDVKCSLPQLIKIIKSLRGILSGLAGIFA